MSNHELKTAFAAAIKKHCGENPVTYRMTRPDAVRRFAPLRPSRWTRFKSWLCSNVKACKSWRLGRCYGMGRSRGIKLFIRNIFF